MKLYYNQVSGSILDVKVDKRNECFNFGIDNAYPSMVEALINMSVTSKTCVDRVSKAIYGHSFGEVGKVVINSDGQSLNEVLRISAREYSKHNICYLQISYNLNYEITSLVPVPVAWVRVGKADDKGYSGKYLIYDNWDKSKGKRINSNYFTVIDKFNPREDVIEGQIEAAGTIVDYNGQLLQIQKESAFVYSLSDLNPVLSEALLESNSQTFRSRGSQKGFLNTKILATQPFKDDEDRKEFKKDLNGVRGADNSSEVVLMESSQQSDDLSKQIFIGDLSSPYNDKLFEYSDGQAEKNICKAFTVPLVLVNPSDNSMFGNSGEMLKQAKLQLWESREEDRDQLEEVFQKLMESYKEPIQNIEVVNPYGEKVEEVVEIKTEE